MWKPTISRHSWDLSLHSVFRLSLCTHLIIPFII
nr:MAG TPA: hypothetical protein [Bacteriophage sp.]